MCQEPCNLPCNPPKACLCAVPTRLPNLYYSTYGHAYSMNPPVSEPPLRQLVAPSKDRMTMPQDYKVANCHTCVSLARHETLETCHRKHWTGSQQPCNPRNPRILSLLPRALGSTRWFSHVAPQCIGRLPSDSKRFQSLKHRPSCREYTHQLSNRQDRIVLQGSTSHPPSLKCIGSPDFHCRR
jgi:hypothetical protein